MANEKELQKTEPKEINITYKSGGQDVNLNSNLIKNFLSKGNSEVTYSDIVMFSSICKYNELNPFLNEAYLIKFGQAPAQMIVSKEAFMKRAEANPDYKGFKAGVIVLGENGVLRREEGCFFLPKEVLVGGWAEVYREGRQTVVATVSLSEYDKKESIWKSKPSTMIRKVALVQALREAFPAQLGAMYTQEEAPSIIDIDADEVKEEQRKLSSNGSDKVVSNIAQVDGNNPFKNSKPQGSVSGNDDEPLLKASF